MSDLTDNLDKLIQKAALDGALTQDAVAQFHSLVKQCDAQSEELLTFHASNKALTKERDELSRKLKIMLDDANELSTRAAAVDASEQEHRDREVRLECAELRVKDHQEMFRVVFRNAVIRKEVMTAIPGTDGGQFQTPIAGYTAKDSVEEEET